MDAMPSEQQAPRPELKERLKQEFARWAIRHFDIDQAFRSWMVLWKVRSLSPGKPMPTGSEFHLAMLALIEAYGRVFTGDNHLQAKPPWVLPEEKVLHDHLMDLRHGSVAHSSADMQRVTLFAPGSVLDGQAVTGDDAQDWAWHVSALRISTPAMVLDAHLRRLHHVIHARVTDVLKRLQSACGNPVLPAGAIRLVDL